MKSLVTGGAGFIGSHLVEALLATGDQVTVVDDLSTGQQANLDAALQDRRCHFIEGSVLDEALVDRLVQSCDRLFHLAAAVGVDLIVKRPVHTIETNICGAQIVLAAAARYGKPILLTSTSEIYGKSTKVPFAKDDDMVYANTTVSRFSYAASKVVDEYLALAYHRQDNLPAVVVRLFNTIGTKQSGKYGMVVPRFVAAALANKPLRVFGDGQQTRCFADVSDVVRAMLQLMDEPKACGQVFNIGSDVPVTIEQLAKRVIALSVSLSRIELVPYEQAYEPGFQDMYVRQPSLAKIATAIGYQPERTLDQSLTGVIEWMRQEQVGYEAKRVGLSDED